MKKKCLPKKTEIEYIFQKKSKFCFQIGLSENSDPRNRKNDWKILYEFYFTPLNVPAKIIILC